MTDVGLLAILLKTGDKMGKTKEMADEVVKFLGQKNVIVFAGAGVGCRVGMPSWTTWLNQLGDVCDRYGERTAGILIKERVTDGNLLEAAAIYKTCKKIPDGERWKELAKSFKPKAPKIEALNPLIRLPIKGIVTTNYDRTLHDAYAKEYGKTAMPLELDDGTFKNGTMMTEYFIARIHGRAEKPESMIVDTTDYQKLEADDVYKDYLTSILKYNCVLFVGFSFCDPAIKNVLKFYKECFGPTYQAMHMALLPSGINHDLQSAMSEVNMRVITYAKDDEHSVMWKAIGYAATTMAQKNNSHGGKARPDEDRSNLQKVIAFTYARAQASSDLIMPAKEMVLDGIVLSLIEAARDKGVAKIELIKRIQTLLKVENKAAEELYKKTLNRLYAEKQLTVADGVVHYIGQKNNSLESEFNALTNAVKDRIKVLKGKEVSSHVSYNIIWEKIFLARTWDLATQYAGAISNRGMQLEDIVYELVEREIGKRNEMVENIAEAIIHILNVPDKKQQIALAEIARAAITVQMVMTAPREAIYSKHIMPTKIYFDASVLMPAIVQGHPMSEGYTRAIRRLIEAIRLHGETCRLAIGEMFIEEILTHKKTATKMVEQLGLEDEEKMMSHILFRGAQNTNVFVGAYSSRFTRKDKKERQTFKEFMNEVAPYQNEKELISFLKGKGIWTVKMLFRDAHNQQFGTYLNALKDGYGKEQNSKQEKETVLIEHEARQLTKLQLEVREGQRSVFVTADKKLLRIIQSENGLRGLVGNVLTEVGFIGLVDILVGCKPEAQTFTRLIWAATRNEVQKQVQDYLIAKTLRYYDEAMVKAMPEVIEDILTKKKDETIAIKGDIQDALNIESAKRVESYLDRLEDAYFESMKSTIQRGY